MDKEHIVCPYCFETFSHTDVHFRLESVSDTYFSQDDFGRASTPEEAEEMYRGYLFQAKDDEKYQGFWKDFGETTELTTEDERRLGCEVYRLPVIDPQSEDGRKCLRFWHDQTGEETCFNKDQRGMVYSVIDINGRESHRRLCPYCHNPIPDGYGVSDAKFISVIGTTGSGKTVYISQLLRRMEEYMSTIDFPAHPKDARVHNFIAANPVKKDTRLPIPTRAAVFSQPMTYDIRLPDSTYQTLVIYDIAGENCVDAQQMVKYGQFIKNSDGIILLIDPKSIGLANDGRAADEGRAGATAVLNAIHGAILTFGTHVDQAENKCTLPIAVCLSKSDCFADEMAMGKANQEHIRRLAKSDPSPVRDEKDPMQSKHLFNATEYNLLQEEILNIFRDTPVYTSLKNEYSFFNFFIFSAIGCEVVKRTEDGIEASYPVADPNPARLSEPLLWLFKRFNFIGSDIPVRLPVHRPERQVFNEKQTWWERLFKKNETRPMNEEERKALWFEEY